MVDYGKTKIYRIPVGDKNYYGHTTQSLSHRAKKHRNDFKNSPNRKIYKAMRENNMTEKDIELIWVEDYPCENKEQAKARERYWIENYGTLNIMLPWKEGQTRKQNQSEANKRHYYKHHDQQLERIRKYREEHREEMNEKKREYRAEHKEELNAERRAKRWVCPHCDIEICRDGKSRHIKRRHPQILS